MFDTFHQDSFLSKPMYDSTEVLRYDGTEVFWLLFDCKNIGSVKSVFINKTELSYFASYECN